MSLQLRNPYKNNPSFLVAEPEMAARRMAPESFDAIMQVKAKRYRLDQSDPINEALHQLRGTHA